MTTEERYQELWSALQDGSQTLHPRFFLSRAARLWPERLALICEDEALTFAQLDYAASVGAAHLIKQGVKPDDRVLILYENSIDFYIAYHAAWRAGAIVVPLNVFLSAEEVAYVAHDAQPRLALASEKQRPKLTDVSFPVLDIESFLDIHNRQGTTTAPELPAESRNLDTCTVLLYTSGTTGRPKGVMLSGREILTNCIQSISNFEVTAAERMYAALPLFHSYMQNTAVWSPLVMGAQVIVIPQITRKALLRALDFKPTIIVGIPQLFGLFCMLKQTTNFDTVRFFFSGGDALPDKIRLAFELLYGRRIANGYGLTETCPVISAVVEDTWMRSQTIGKPFLGLEVEIRDQEGRALSQGSIGALWVKGGNVMMGYYNAPEATAAIMRDGWLDTGDLASFDQGGNLIFAGRLKDLIVSKGIKIYPQEVENVLMMHPVITHAGVVGLVLEHDETPVAFVAANRIYPELESELKTLCQTRLAPYKVPSEIIVRASLSVTSTGKVDKKVLRAELQQRSQEQKK